MNFNNLINISYKHYLIDLDDKHKWFLVKDKDLINHVANALLKKDFDSIIELIKTENLCIYDSILEINHECFYYLYLNNTYILAPYQNELRNCKSR